MQRTIIAALVGAVILFIYQAMSWIALPIHKDAMKYTSNQDSVIAYLSKHLPEDGMYGMPIAPKNASAEEHKAMMDKGMGKPFAMINYHAAMKGDMAGNMIIGFIINLIATFIIAMLLVRTSGIYTSFGARLMIVMGFSIVIICQSFLMELNWMGSPMHYIMGWIIDALLGWLLCGIWLAWYTGRKKAGA